MLFHFLFASWGLEVPLYPFDRWENRLRKVLGICQGYLASWWCEVSTAASHSHIRSARRPFPESLPRPSPSPARGAACSPPMPCSARRPVPLASYL